MRRSVLLPIFLIVSVDILGLTIVIPLLPFYAEKYGADVVRLFLMFIGPWELGGPWNPRGVEGVVRFLNRVWGLPKESLWATVYAGDEKTGVPPDEEAEALWREVTDIDRPPWTIFAIELVLPPDKHVPPDYNHHNHYHCRDCC